MCLCAYLDEMESRVMANERLTRMMMRRKTRFGRWMRRRKRRRQRQMQRRTGKMMRRHRHPTA